MPYLTTTGPLQLLRTKVDVNLTNEHGNTPLHYACFWSYQGVADDLIQAGGIVTIANRFGTPLAGPGAEEWTMRCPMDTVRCAPSFFWCIYWKKYVSSDMWT